MRTKRRVRHDDANAFLPDPDGGPIPADDDVEGELLEGFMKTATTSDASDESIRSEDFVEELGGPFVLTTAGTELAEGFDESNPPDGFVAAVPSPMRGR